MRNPSAMSATPRAASVTSSWATFDPGDNGVGIDPDGFHGAVFDGRYVYFVPYYNGNDYHGEVLRYDTVGGFSEVSSWATFDAGANGLGTDPDGYSFAVFDGRYVYFGPTINTSSFQHHGEVLRYDTVGAFLRFRLGLRSTPGPTAWGPTPTGKSPGRSTGDTSTSGRQTTAQRATARCFGMTPSGAFPRCCPGARSMPGITALAPTRRGTPAPFSTGDTSTLCPALT